MIVQLEHKLAFVILHTSPARTKWLLCRAYAGHIDSKQVDGKYESRLGGALIWRMFCLVQNGSAVLVSVLGRGEITGQ